MNLRTVTRAGIGGWIPVLGLLLASQAAAETPRRVVLLPIVVHASSPDSAYLSEGLADMLAARLEQGGEVDVRRLATNDRSTTKTNVAVEAARGAGAEYVVFGSFTQFGSGASLDVRCARVTAEDAEEGADARRVFVQSGAIGDIIPKLDDLAAKLRRHITGRATRVGSVADTPPPAASNGPEIAELQKRVDALERALYEQGAANSESPEAVAGEGS